LIRQPSFDILLPSKSSEYHKRLNIVISAWICIAIGSAIIVSYGGSSFSFAVAVPLSLGGIILLFIGLGMDAQKSISPKQIASWVPDASLLPDAGRAMYRVDTTLNEPIRTSILCGKCGNVVWVEGRKPSLFSCNFCNILLWEEE